MFVKGIHPLVSESFKKQGLQDDHLLQTLTVFLFYTIPGSVYA